MMLNYINKRYKPSKDELIAEFYVDPFYSSLETAASHIAKESSIGTWTELSTMNWKVAQKLKPTVYSLDKEKNIIKIAYPVELFEQGNMPQILSSIAGNIFGMKAIRNLKLLDVGFPKKLVQSFKGPKFGIKGIRKILNVKTRPLLGTIVKPKVGLTPKQHAKVAYEAWIGGLDIVKDDENLTSQSFNPFNNRINETLKMRDKAEKETGEKKIYMPNITAETNTMLKRAEYVKSLGGEYIMVDILTAGFSALQTIRDSDPNMVIHAHRAMHAALTRNPKHGISMLTIGKIARLIGVDQLHIGTAIGKMHGCAAEVTEVEEEIEDNLIHEDNKGHVLEQKWYNIKPVFAVASGGLHPRLTPELINIMGHNIIAQFGGGCHGHPNGTLAGAKAIRQSLESSLQEVPLEQYAQTHEELRQALQKWKH